MTIHKCLTMLRVDNHINVAPEEELENDSVAVFKEDRDRIARDIEELRGWILSTPHMQNVRQDDLFLRLFLRGCNYSLPATKEKLDLYFTVRSDLKRMALT